MERQLLSWILLVWTLLVVPISLSQQISSAPNPTADQIVSDIQRTRTQSSVNSATPAAGPKLSFDEIKVIGILVCIGIGLVLLALVAGLRGVAKALDSAATPRAGSTSIAYRIGRTAKRFLSGTRPPQSDQIKPPFHGESQLEPELRLNRPIFIGVCVMIAVGIVILILNLNLTPSESQARKYLEGSVKSQSNDNMMVLSFEKTNGISSEIFGQKLYDMEFSAEFEFLNDGIWDGRFKALRGTPSDYELQTLYFGNERVRNGEIKRITGHMRFVKAENGWRVVAVGTGNSPF